MIYTEMQTTSSQNFQSAYLYLMILIADSQNGENRVIFQIYYFYLLKLFFLLSRDVNLNCWCWNCFWKKSPRSRLICAWKMTKFEVIFKTFKSYPNLSKLYFWKKYWNIETPGFFIMELRNILNLFSLIFRHVPLSRRCLNSPFFIINRHGSVGWEVQESLGKEYQGLDFFTFSWFFKILSSFSASRRDLVLHPEALRLEKLDRSVGSPKGSEGIG